MFKRLIIIFLLFCVAVPVLGQYTAGDFGSTTSGNWAVSGTWKRWNGSAWVAVSAIGPVATLGAVTGGSGYTNGSYTGIVLTGGTGSGASATIIVAGGVVTTVTLTANGDAYTPGNVLTATLPGGSGFSVNVATVSTISAPVQSRSVHIFSGHTVYTPAGTSYPCKDLNVYSGGKLWSNGAAVNVYLNVFGNILCDGTIGNGVTFDAISFNIEGAACTISGAGAFDASRIRKNTVASASTVLTISRDVNLRFAASSQTQIYNAAPGRSRFDVVIGAGATLNLTGGAGITGNASIDGTTGTAGVDSAAGSYTINGTMIVSGNCYWVHNNNAAGDSVTWTINPGGLLRTQSIVCTPQSVFTQSCVTSAGSTSITTSSTASMSVGMVLTGTGIPGKSLITAILNSTTFTISNAVTFNSASNPITFYNGSAGHRVTIHTGGKLDITGVSPAGMPTALSTLNKFNVFDFRSGSYSEFSGAGLQSIPPVPSSPSSNGYGYLKISGSGIKTAQGALRIVNDIDIVNTSGTPVFDCNLQLVTLLGNWNNYSNAGFFEGSSTTGPAVEFAGTTVQTINCPDGEVFNILRYNKPTATTVQFNCPVTVKSTLDWSNNGPFDLNGYRLTLLNPATSAIQNGAVVARYIISEKPDNSALVYWYTGTPAGDSIYQIPFGKTGGYLPVTITVHAGAPIDTLVAATYGTGSNNLPWPTSPIAITNLTSAIGLTPDNRNATVDRFWYISKTAPGAATIGLTLYYTFAELPGSPWNSSVAMAAQHWNPLTNGWDYPPIGTGSGSSYSVNIPATPNFGIWTLSNQSSPLPVEWLSFRAIAFGNQVSCSWSTASENNCDYFELERGQSPADFQPIMRVSSMGTTTTGSTYHHTDPAPLKGLSYYRVCETDVDGRKSYSRVNPVYYYGTETLLLYPQPVDEEANIFLPNSINGQTVVAEVFNGMGELVLQEQIQSGLSEVIRLNMSGLAKGMYLLKMHGDGFQLHVNFLKF